MNATAPAAVAAATTAPATRLDSIDLLRGLVMVLMALDHARDFYGGPATSRPTDLDHTTAALFFTRFVTHFCAPVFVFLAGTGAALQARRGKPPGALARFLVTRGLWLVLLEVTIVRFGWTFDLYYHFTPLQVIWAIGWSMVALAPLVYLPPWVAGALGVAMVVAHNLLDGVHAPAGGALEGLWSVLHEPRGFALGAGHYVRVIYPLVPWIGVMAAGYALGALLARPAAARRRALFSLGGATVLAFVALRALDGYGDPSPWSRQASALYTSLSFLNCTKYPPSLDYLLMTLGPSLLALGLLDGLRVDARHPLLVFGRVPLFYYLLHLPLLHGGALIVAWVGGGAVQAGGLGLLGTYLACAIAVAALYPVCLFYARFKQRWRSPWLSYL